MNNIKLLFAIAIMSGCAHFAVFMTAYDINLRYVKMDYRFKRIDRKSIAPFRFLYAFPGRYDSKISPFLLTIDGEKWALLHYIIDVPLCFACYHCLGHIGAKDRLVIVWCVLTGAFVLLSFWIHRASNTVIRLSNTKAVSTADLERHLKSKLRSAQKKFPEPQYLCEIIENKSRNLFWTHEEWTIIVSAESNSEVVLEKAIANRVRYRYYDGAVIELIDRFAGIHGTTSNPAC